MSVSLLTKKERLVLYCRQNNINQAGVLKQKGLKYHQQDRLDKLPLKPLKANEWCIVFRLRKGVTQRELAEELDVVRTYVHSMETLKENPARLIEYWRDNVPTVFEHVVSKWPMDTYGNRPREESNATNYNKNIPKQ